MLNDKFYVRTDSDPGIPFKTISFLPVTACITERERTHAIVS